MYNLLIKLMLIATALEFGISISEFKNCHKRSCVQMFEKRSRDVLRVDWKPISVWPKEAKKFR